MKDNLGFDWGWCNHCDAPFVRCSKCGNNCCNGGTQKLPNGEPCGCDEAYAHQDLCKQRNCYPTKDMFDIEETNLEDDLMKKIFNQIEEESLVEEVSKTFSR